MNSLSVLTKFLLGFILIYGTLELLARLLGDALPLKNALLITGAVLVVALVVEIGLFRQNWQQALLTLGLGWSGGRALGIAVLISALQLAAYPLITWLTGYRWTLPPNWPWTAVEADGATSIQQTDAALGLVREFVPVSAPVTG